MTKDELHLFLTSNFDLVVDHVEKGAARSYFIGKVVWHPSSTTRILHVQYDADEHVSHIKLCASSDNNNSVFVPLPINWPELHQAVIHELSWHVQREYRCDRLNLVQICRTQHYRERARILVEAFDLTRAKQRHNPWLLRQEPRKGDLCRSRVVLLRDVA